VADIDLDAIEARHVAAVMGTGKVGSSAADVPALVAEVRSLREDAEEGDALRTKLADLLSRTAVALNGPEPDLVQWSWHDLPEKAQYAMTLLLAVKSYDDANQSDLPLGLLDSIRAICAALDVRHDPSATTDGGEG